MSLRFPVILHPLAERKHVSEAECLIVFVWQLFPIVNMCRCLDLQGSQRLAVKAKRQSPQPTCRRQTGQVGMADTVSLPERASSVRTDRDELIRAGSNPPLLAGRRQRQGFRSPRRYLPSRTITPPALRCPHRTVRRTPDIAAPSRKLRNSKFIQACSI